MFVFKSLRSSSKVKAELERVRKENDELRTKMDELSKPVKPPDSDERKLLERIMLLETLREKNGQKLLVQEQEVERLRQQLVARGGEVVASLQAQLEQQKKDIEQRDMMFRNLSQETENLKTKLATVTARCQSLEVQVVHPLADLALVQDELKDALEKNQQWVVYNQQRDTYVQSILAHTHELEQQLAQAKQQHRSETGGGAMESCTSTADDPDLKVSFSQMNGLQTSLQDRNEDQRRIAALEQQIQLCTMDHGQNENVDRQSTQRQLHKVLTELRKARHQIARLQSAPNTHFSESTFNRIINLHNELEFECVHIDDKVLSKVSNLLDERFLQCPRCWAYYLPSHHRELLAHMDHCLT